MSWGGDWVPPLGVGCWVLGGARGGGCQGLWAQGGWGVLRGMGYLWVWGAVGCHGVPRVVGCHEVP